MAHALYMDTCVESAITNGLRARGVDVLTTQEDGHAETPDRWFWTEPASWEGSCSRETPIFCGKASDASGRESDSRG